MHDPKTKYPAFACSYSPSVPGILRQLNGTLVISTYQAGEVLFIGSKGDDKLVQLPRNFKKAMGIAYEPGRMAVACLDEVILFANSPQLAFHYPNKPNTYDALFVPRATYHTGYLDIHDLEFGRDGLYAVNTYFSCLVRIDEKFNFTPVWKPPFITALASEDRCHLNGMAMVDGLPRYATAFNQGDSPRSWKDGLPGGGILIDIKTNEIIADDLQMPHSPRVYGDKIYLLQSATGELISIGINTGQQETIVTIDGFVRGLSIYNDIAFIGLSKIRKKDGAAFSQLPIAEKAQTAGVVMVDLKTEKIIGQMIYHESVEEIYDVRFLPGLMRPNIMNTLTDDHKAVMIPSTTYWGKRQDKD